jgi:hypothetical protein
MAASRERRRSRRYNPFGHRELGLISSAIDGPASVVRYPAPSKSRLVALPCFESNDIVIRGPSMRSLIRSMFLVAALVACGGIPGRSTDEDNAGKMETGKMGGAMDKMETGKMGGAMDKTDTGKLGGAMDKTGKGKME